MAIASVDVAGLQCEIRVDVEREPAGFRAVIDHEGTTLGESRPAQDTWMAIYGAFVDVARSVCESRAEALDR
jgi:hypothetical protein